MRRKVYFGIAAALALACAGAGRAAWRAHKNIVSLHVRNVPLAKVIRSLERQTWEKILVDSRLDTKVTLDLDDLPLTEALGKVSEQAGGVVSTIHAVYQSVPALETLVAAARQGDINKAAGWTNVAPKIEDFGDLPDPGSLDGEGAVHEGGAGVRRRIVMTRDVAVSRGGPGQPMGAPKESAPVIRVERFGGGPGGGEDVLVPEQLVMETSLEPRLNKETLLAPDESGAAAAAGQVKGRSITLYVLKKPAFAFHQMPMLGRSQSQRIETVRNVEGGNPGKDMQDLMMAEAERGAMRANLGRYQDLTPEQRVERAREHRKESHHP